MAELRITRLADGSSDRALLPILVWLLRRHGVGRDIGQSFADLGRSRRPPRTLAARIRAALELFPCDLLFVHRDAEREDRRRRIDEIQRACRRAGQAGPLPPVIGVVPVRMQEAWLLFDEAAIRDAAGNPRGRESLGLPDLKQVEELPDPKRILHTALRQASGLRGRRLAGFDSHSAVRRLADILPDFSALDALPAFERLNADVRRVVTERGWPASDD